MPLNRTRSCVAIGLLAILAASPALGQDNNGLDTAQPFAAADLSTWGSPHIEPHEGYFFSFDGMYWGIPAPRTARIGAPGFKNVATGVLEVIVDADNQFPEAVTFAETSTEDTSGLNMDFEAAQRFEFGRVEDGAGWLVSIFRWGPGEQDYLSPNANVLFDDPIDPDTGHGLIYGAIGSGELITGGTDLGVVSLFGNLPTVFTQIAVHNEIDVWGVEANYLRRNLTCHNGGNVELFLGARYLEFNETFGVIATGGVLDANTRWETDANNHIIGPQVGARYFKQQGRWIVSTEGRFMAGLNRQNIYQFGSFGYTGTPGSIQKPLAWLGAEYSHRATLDEFSPLVELRFDLRYVITRAIDFRVGWTGFWVDGIARPNGMTHYAVPDMGIDTTANKQGVFVNGVTIGFDVNR